MIHPYTNGVRSLIYQKSNDYYIPPGWMTNILDQLQMYVILTKFSHK